jgi:hypothetical protein
MITLQSLHELSIDALESLRKVVETAYDRITEAQQAQYQCRVCMCSPSCMIFLPCKHQVRETPPFRLLPTTSSIPQSHAVSHIIPNRLCVIHVILD